MGIITFILKLIFILCVFSLGWIGHIVYGDIVSDRIVNGLFLSNVNESRAKEIANNMDSRGDWVCINVKDMAFPKAYETCVHECSHKAYSEIFAEECEDDFEGCMEIISRK